MRPPIPSLLLADQFAPLTDEIGFVELPHDAAVAAFVNWQQSIPRSTSTLLVHRVEGDLPRILNQMEPLASVERTRITLVPTASTWTALFDNLDRGADLVADTFSLARRTGRRTVRIVARLDRVDGIDRSGSELPSATFHLQGAEERYLSAWVNDVGRRTWDAIGPEQPFENPAYYLARRKADRLTIPIIAEYASALGLRPFDADFYAPDGYATIVEAHGRRSPLSKDVSLARVQRRLAEGWFSIGDYES